MKEVAHFVEPIADFSKKPIPFQIEAFAWFIHEVKQLEHFGTSEIRKCFEAAHLPSPANVASSLTKLTTKRPARLLRSTKGYRMSKDARAELEKLLPVRATSVKTTKELTDLVKDISNPVQKAFLTETLICFKHHAYRASVVMAWNLAFSDVLDRILASHLDAFNAQVGTHGFRRPITTRADFEDLKEGQVLTLARQAHILSKETMKTLTEKLDKRNTAAHPSNVVVGAPTAEEVIFDLVRNVLLKAHL